MGIEDLVKIALAKNTIKAGNTIPYHTWHDYKSDKDFINHLRINAAVDLAKFAEDSTRIDHTLTGGRGTSRYFGEDAKLVSEAIVMTPAMFTELLEEAHSLGLQGVAD